MEEHNSKAMASVEKRWGRGRVPMRTRAFAWGQTKAASEGKKWSRSRVPMETREVAGGHTDAGSEVKRCSRGRAPMHTREVAGGQLQLGQVRPLRAQTDSDMLQRFPIAKSCGKHALTLRKNANRHLVRRLQGRVTSV